jgi:hypothetical protein
MRSTFNYLNTDQHSHKGVRGVVSVALLFVAIHSIAMCVFPLLPFVDLPNHLAEATVYKFAGEPGNALSQYYKPTPWFFPNTFHTVFCSLFPSVEMGNRIFHVAYVVLLPLSVFLVVRELGGNLVYSLLALLFTYNYNLTFGFVGFAMSIPILIFFFYFLLRTMRTEAPVHKVGLSLLLILLFLMHAQNALLALAMFACVTVIGHWKAWKKMFYQLVIVPIPLLVMMCSWWITRGSPAEESTIGYLLEYYQHEFLGDLRRRVGLIGFDNYQLADGIAGKIIAAVFFLCILIPVARRDVWRGLRRRLFESPELAYSFAFFFVALACYALLPRKLPGQEPLFQRFGTVVILSFILFGSVLLKDVINRSHAYWIPLVLLLYSGAWLEYMYSFNRINASFNKELFSEMPDSARLAGLIYDNKYRGKKLYVHFPNYYITWKRGIAASKIIDYRFGVVRRVADESRLPFYEEMIGDHYAVFPAYKNVDYLLVRGKPPVQNDANLHGFREVKRAGNWVLYRHH